MTKYKDIFSVVIFAIVVHTALTASLVNMFMTLSYVKSDVPFQYGGPIDLTPILGAEESNWAVGRSTDVVGKYEPNLSLDNYRAPIATNESHFITKSNKAKSLRYMMW